MCYIRFNSVTAESSVCPRWRVFQVASALFFPYRCYIECTLLWCFCCGQYIQTAAVMLAPKSLKLARPRSAVFVGLWTLYKDPAWPCVTEWKTRSSTLWGDEMREQKWGKLVFPPLQVWCRSKEKADMPDSSESIFSLSLLLRWAVDLPVCLRLVCLPAASSAVIFDFCIWRVRVKYYNLYIPFL